MPSCCIAYITDQDYLFPTLISAIQARCHAAPELADVVIFHMATGSRVERDFAWICAAENIRLIAVDAATVDGANPMMARLFMNRFVPDDYSQYLYLDGDVQITGSLNPLLRADVPEGHFLAASDPMTFMLSEDGPASRSLTAHMQSIGLQPDQAARYFNTGVLRINRTGWDRIGWEAWQLTRRGKRGFRFPDQDPLNIVGANTHRPMSLAWNFPIFMMNARVERDIQPRVYHFMSNPKPWHGAFQPWRRESHQCYAALLARYPTLEPYYRRMPLNRRLRYHLQQRYKQMTEIVTWGRSPRRNRILQYEAELAYDLR